MRFPLCLVLVLAAGCSRDPTGRLVAQLESSDVVTRRGAAREIGEHPPAVDERLVGALAKTVGDSDEQVRVLSAKALGAIGSGAKAGVPALERGLEDSQASVRTQAALAIARIEPGNKKFVPVLAAAMRGGDGRLLLEIGAIGPQAVWAVPSLIELLSHPSPQMRALAAQTLGRIGPGAAEAKPALERAARDSNAAVRGAAQAALDGLK